MSVNKVILIGNVGKDPEVRYLDNNLPICKMSLATSEVYKNKAGEKVTTTEWHNVILWRGLAEVAEKYVKKDRRYILRADCAPALMMIRIRLKGIQPKLLPM